MSASRLEIDAQEPFIPLVKRDRPSFSIHAIQTTARLC